MIIPLVLGGILDNTFVFLTLIVGIFGFIGLFSQSFLVASFSAFLAFATLALESQYSIFISALFILIAAIVIFTSFQLYNLTENNAGGV